MDTGQQRIFYQFQTNVDLTYKADHFLKSINHLEMLSTQLQNIIKNETENSSGKIFDRINEIAETNTNERLLYYDSSKTSMKNLASRYTDLINDMNFQYITIHYDIHVNEMKND